MTSPAVRLNGSKPAHSVVGTGDEEHLQPGGRRHADAESDRHPERHMMRRVVEREDVTEQSSRVSPPVDRALFGRLLHARVRSPLLQAGFSPTREMASMGS